jgi:hypothetical protein
MATFIKVDSKAGVLVLAAVLLGIWFYVAPDHAAETFASIRQSFMGVVP